MRALVLSSRLWELTDDDGQIRKGIKISYVDPEGEDDPNGEGLPPMSLSGPATMGESLRSVPGVYDLDLRMRPGKNNRPVISLAGATLVEGVDIAKIVKSAKPTGRG